MFNGDKVLAEKYAGNPNNSLPEFLYGYTTKKGKGLGNTQAGDGARFIGRGYIQLTGRANYAKYSKLMNSRGLLPTADSLITDPKLLSDSKIAAQVSVLYMLDRCKLSQTNAGYFEAASKSIGYNTADIKAKKQGYYECFLGQLTGATVGSGTNGILVDSSGRPVKTGTSQ